jgi:NAD(P)-dependent dehydrogenase (short-subunit alcohol dehydrogenase family)
MGLLEGKVAVVTGAASGIGLGTAELFVSEGAKVVLADIDDARGEASAASLGASATYLHTDVTSDADVEAVVAKAVEEFGRLDVFFNNAGAAGDQNPLRDTDPDGFDRTLALLVKSVALGHKHALRQFERQGGGGAIISTASAAGLQGGWSAPAYTASKHAVIGLVRQAAAELRGTGVRSNAICPGIIMTPIMAKAFGVPLEDAAEFEEFLGDKLKDAQPCGRVGTPLDIARAAVFLASDLSEFVTGAALPVDGGATSVILNDFAGLAAAAAAEFAQRRA